MSTQPTEDLVAAALADEARFKPFDQGGPEKSGYYHVRDCKGQQGVAFMNRNRTWTLIDNARLTKPLAVWRDIP